MVKISKNGLKISKMVQNGRKDQKLSKFPNMVKITKKWSKIIQNGPNGQKWRA